MGVGDATQSCTKLVDLVFELIWFHGPAFATTWPYEIKPGFFRVYGSFISDVIDSFGW
jgi:hypothetical protein